MKHIDQNTLFADGGWQVLPLPSASIRLWRDWLDVDAAHALYDHLATGLQWDQPSLTIAGKVHPIPRFQAWYGDGDAIYRYSGTTFVPTPWTAELNAVRRRLEEMCEARFNSVLANWYHHGAHSMGFHADNEPELGPEPVIASLSLGGARRFVLRPRRGLGAESFSVILGDGDLLEMSGETQRYWHHGVPKTTRPVAPRINLTFRLIYAI
jgi:alkylated DNA repair dioxygenase AlkB